MVRIKDATPLECFKVRLTLTDGQTIERDLEPLLQGPVFEKVRRDPAFFASMRIERGTLTWPGDIDLCRDTIIAAEQSETFQGS